MFKDIAQLNPLFRDQITNFSINQVASNVFDEPDKLADFAAAVSTGDVQELQDVLESLVVEDRLRKSLLVLKKELINAQLQSKLSRDVDSHRADCLHDCHSHSHRDETFGQVSQSLSHLNRVSRQRGLTRHSNAAQTRRCPPDPR